MESRINSAIKPLGQFAKTVSEPSSDDLGKALPSNRVVEENQPVTIDSVVNTLWNMQLPLEEKILLTLLCRNGLRISEITNPSFLTVSSTSECLVWSFKQKAFKTCQMFECAQYLTNPNTLTSIQNWQRSRQYYYRLLQKVLPSDQISNRENQAVTHLPRYIIAQEIYSVTNSVDEVSKAIGNSTKSATMHYL